MIQVKNIGHIYEGEESVEALRNINLKVKKGEIASVIGSSGCGKTTFLKILSGLLTPTAGQVHLNGNVVDSVPEEVGIIFQSYDDTLMKWRNVYKNVEVGAKLGNDEDIEKKTEAALSMVGLERFKNSYPQELSGGMKQRVQVARLLAYEPDVLLCDEPFGALDAQTKEDLQDEFLRILERKSISTIFVTHDIEEALYLSDTVYVFTSTNPGMIGQKKELNYPRPRYPKHEFEISHAQSVTELKKSIKDTITNG